MRSALLPLALGSFCLTALAAPCPARGEGSVVLFPALGRPTLVSVTGRVLKSAPEAQAKATSSSLRKNVERLTARSWEGAQVQVSFLGQTRELVSGDEGLFEATFPAPQQSPFPTGLQPVRAAVGELAAEGQVEVVSDAAPFLVISDFDDTVAVTGVLSKRQLLKSAFLADEESQPAVEGMAAFYGCLRQSNPVAPGFAFVSGSPIEFAGRLQAFLARGGFPFAALHLRDLGPSTLSHYKEPVLRALLSRFPQRVVLVGDSGEADPEVYGRIREEFPGRVAAIFIRDAGRSAQAARYQEMVLFKTAADAAREAAAQGLLAPSCLAQVGPALPGPVPASEGKK